MLPAFLEWLNKLTLWQRMSILEARMGQVDLALNELNLATNEVADELDFLRENLSVTDEATAGRISSVVTRLRAMAQSETDPDPEGNVGTPDEG